MNNDDIVAQLCMKERRLASWITRNPDDPRAEFVTREHSLLNSIIDDVMQSWGLMLDESVRRKVLHCYNRYVKHVVKHGYSQAAMEAPIWKEAEQAVRAATNKAGDLYCDSIRKERVRYFYEHR